MTKKGPRLRSRFQVFKKPEIEMANSSYGIGLLTTLIPLMSQITLLNTQRTSKAALLAL